MRGRGGIWTFRCAWPLSSHTGCQGGHPDRTGTGKVIRGIVREAGGGGILNVLLSGRAVIEGRTLQLVEALMANKMTKEEIAGKFWVGEIESDMMLAQMADANRKPPGFAVAEKSGWLSIYFDGLRLPCPCLTVRRGPALRRAGCRRPWLTWRRTRGDSQGQEEGKLTPSTNWRSTTGRRNDAPC